MRIGEEREGSWEKPDGAVVIYRGAVCVLEVLSAHQELGMVSECEQELFVPLVDS